MTKLSLVWQCARHESLLQEKKVFDMGKSFLLLLWLTISTFDLLFIFTAEFSRPGPIRFMSLLPPDSCLHAWTHYR